MKYTATAEDEGARCDVLLAGKLEISRTRAAALLKNGKILKGENGAAATVPVKPSSIVRPGDTFNLPRLEKSPRAALKAVPEDIPLDIIYEDSELLVVNKPWGMVVHPAPGHYTGTLVNALLSHINTPLDSRLEARRPGIVHRLDKDTSGLLVVAKTFESQTGLSEQIRNRTASRIYLALSLGHWSLREGIIESRIGRGRHNRKKMAVLSSQDAREAVTGYRVLKSYSVAELVEVRLHTGRTHQIRVHFAHKGHPVLGDTLYGGKTVALRGYKSSHPRLVQALLGSTDRQALHAARLSFEHPGTGQRLSFECPVPADMEQLLHILENPPD
ncbi:MAG: RluA family pseudouridine synthase [Gemmatimonadota bacterium]|nr:RluA family pseudouridine synthase [Gemmatimonadota bacterium]